MAATFAANGFLVGSWVPRIPEVKHHLGLSDAALGVALLAPAVGALLSMRWSGRASARVGSARTTRIAFISFCALSCLPGLATNLGLLWLALMLWGTALGGLDVAMNAQGVTVEHEYQRPVLSSFHAAWSLGSLVGALAGGLGAAWRVPLAAQQGVLGAVLIVIVVVLGRAYLVDPPAVDDPAPAARHRGLPEWRLILLGVAAVCALLSEGAVADWSGVLLRDHLHVAAAQVGLAYAAFSLTMTGGRLVGDRVVARLGRARSLAVLSLIGAVGLAAGLATDDFVGTVVGFALLGVGLSVMVPVFFSTAADGATPGPAIATVSTFGYSGFLVGPSVIGVIAQATSVPFALWLIPVITLAGGVLGIAAVRLTARRREAIVAAEPGTVPA